jgi:hypothetical protein
VVVILEETPPHPAQKSAAAKNKDVKTDFMSTLLTYTREVLVALFRCICSVLCSPKVSRAGSSAEKMCVPYAMFALIFGLFITCDGGHRGRFELVPRSGGAGENGLVRVTSLRADTKVSAEHQCISETKLCTESFRCAGASFGGFFFAIFGRRCGFKRAEQPV